MIGWLLGLQVFVDLTVALILVILGTLKRKPSRFSLGTLALVELGLLAQAVTSVVLVAGGAKAKQDTVEFFAYVLVALIIPVGSGFWALVERTRWSTLVLAAASLTAVVMLFRMQQIWNG